MSVATRPLRTDEDHQAALVETKRLWGAKPGTPEGDRLDLLLVLINAYEDEHHDIEAPDPIDAIIECMEVQDLSRQDLALMLEVGSGRVSEILNRRRRLTVNMIRRLSVGLGLSEHCLLQDYELEKERQYA